MLMKHSSGSGLYSRLTLLLEAGYQSNKHSTVVIDELSVQPAKVPFIKLSIILREKIF